MKNPILKKRYKKSLNKFILLLTSSILLYSFVIDFILRKYDNPTTLFLINFQEKIYWIIVAVIFLCILFLFMNNIRFYKIKHLNKKILITVIILLIISSVRFWDLSMLPLNIDESDAYFGLAMCMWDNEFFQTSCAENYANVPINNKDDRGFAVFGSLVFLNLHIFKNPVLTVRIISVFMGILTVILTFFFIKDLYGYKVGILSSLFLALLPWHVIQSRTGIGEILIPFFGLLIFYTFNKTLKSKNIGFLFLTSIFLGIGSFYIYASSRIFLVIIIFLIIINYKKLAKYGVKNIMISIFIFFLFLYPHLALTHISDYQFGKHTKERIPPHLSIDSYIHNLKSEFNILFINVEGWALYAQSLKGPLLSTSLAIIAIFAFVYDFILRKIDLRLFVWFMVPILCVPIFSVIKIEYLLSILPFFLIFISKFLNDFSRLSYIKLKKKRINCKKIIFPVTILVICFILFNLIFSLIMYFQNAPKDLDENRAWSYGVEQATNFVLEKELDNNKLIIFEDERMTSRRYMWYYYFLKGYNYSMRDLKKQNIKYAHLLDEKIKDIKNLEREYLDKEFKIYYLIWNPVTHNTPYWEGKFYKCFKSFNEMHPDEKPIKIIYYPSGEPALNIYEIK